ncbi:MAG: acyl-CoA/acyl-ACP dehydrogenase [Actinomycetota bacterium]|nr:acyl-CoA/acyl-ACP dehydrogenase [Actinomycetota bacterium]
MDFSLDETQQSVADLAATVLRGDADGTRVEQALAGESGYDERLWKAMAQAGLLALALPESLGGDGFGTIEVASVLSEVGRQTVPVPALATLSLGVLPVVALGSTQHQRLLLPEVADGRILTAALRGTPDSTAVTASRHREGYVVTGTRVCVPYAAQAYRILLASHVGVLLIDPSADGVALTRTYSATGSAEYTVELNEVEVPQSELLTTDVRAVERFAVAGAAAMADGVIAGALALTAEHVRNRHQFGKPLATFQAVAQQIADVYITARTLSLTSASVNWRLASGLDADDDLDIAAYWVAAELPTALQVCHHLHGGLGVDYTYPLHRFYSQAKDLARFVGGAAARLDLIGARCSST